MQPFEEFVIFFSKRGQMTGIENQIERINIGGVIFYASQPVGARLHQLLRDSSRYSLRDFDRLQWSEIIAELLLERLKDGETKNEISVQDLEYLTRYLDQHFGNNTERSTSRSGGLPGLTHPLMLVCTFLL